MNESKSISICESAYGGFNLMSRSLLPVVCDLQLRFPSSPYPIYCPCVELWHELESKWWWLLSRTTDDTRPSNAVGLWCLINKYHWDMDAHGCPNWIQSDNPPSFLRPFQRRTLRMAFPVIFRERYCFRYTSLWLFVGEFCLGHNRNIYYYGPRSRTRTRLMAEQGMLGWATNKRKGN